MNKVSKNGILMLRYHEGFSAEWYLDPIGVPTIGVGFTWRSASFREWWGRNRPGVKFSAGARISEAEATDALLRIVNAEYAPFVQEFLGREVDQHVFDAMVSAVYNLGPACLKWRWAEKVKSGDVIGAAALFEHNGTTADGVKLRGLVIRRRHEASLMRSGCYDLPGARGGDAKAMSDGVLRRGEKAVEVRKLIEALRGLGFYQGSRDDVFGYGTEKAVIAFRKAHDMPASAVADSQMFDKLRKLTGGKFDVKVQPKRVPVVVQIGGGAVMATGAVATFWDKIEAFFKGLW